MGFYNVRLFDEVSYGSSGGPGFSTEIIELQSGIEERVSRASQARHRFDARYVVREYPELYSELKTFYMAFRGAKDSFRWKDWVDYATTSTGTTHFATDPSVSNTDVEIGTGDGTTVEFQLVKKYVVASGPTLTRKITKPIESTVTVAVAGVGKTGGGVDYTTNDTTGKITFGTAPTAGQSVTWGGEFDEVVRFGESTDDILSVTLDAFLSGNAGVELVQDVDPAPTPQDIPGGGTKDHGATLTSNLSITQSQGFFHVVRPTTTGLYVILERADDLQAGRPVFAVENLGSQSIAISTDPDDLAGSKVLDLSASSNPVFLLLSTSTAGVKTYRSA